jgi:Zn-dependent M28 family amino/carboxypeptidase
MVSLDRTGVPAASVPLATGGTGTTQVMDALSTAADRAGIPSIRSQDNRASDHWSFEKADIPSARVGSVPYPGYHSAGDVPSVVDPEQLDRVGTIVWTWLQTQ